MIRISDSARVIIFRVGVVLLLVGAALVIWVWPRFNSLPTYQRIASLIPIMCSYPMLRVDRYCNWASVHGLERGYAVGALIAPPMLLLGSIVWFIASPATHG
jgi:hypothetical protein